ncbi:hypothetical protein AB6A40_010155 [Gnathostoma spinigerum]|uniref:Uncharacterized protein n=1 Tax=Gnathostoma spinigerum TaxID=75299 RepID=A0ABD6EVR6_9BILA
MQCFDDYRQYPENFVWLRKEHFNVTCKRGIIVVLNCVSDRGTMIPLNTESFWEDGVEYSCSTDEAEREEVETSGEGSGEDNDEMCGVSAEYVSNHFLISCITKRILGCIDENNDLVKLGYFLLKNSQLSFCYVSEDGKIANIEYRGKTL